MKMYAATVMKIIQIKIRGLILLNTVDDDSYLGSVR